MQTRGLSPIRMYFYFSFRRQRFRRTMDEPSYSSLKNYLYLLPTGLLFIKISCSVDATGISGKTQILNALVISLRCLSYITLPNVPLHGIIVNFLCIIFVYGAVLMVLIVFKDVYYSDEDNVRLDYLLVPVAVIGICLPDNRTMYNVCTILSASLEAVSIIPQYLYTCKKNHYSVILPLYIVFLMFYASLCLGENIYNYFEHIVQFEPLIRICIASGVMQLVLYSIFAVSLCKRSRGSVKFNTSKGINVDEICNEITPISEPILVE